VYHRWWWQWLLRQFPQTRQIVTPWSDPAFPTRAYQAFLRELGYTNVTGHPAYGKPGPSTKKAARRK
jgi:hypothetical protein